MSGGKRDTHAENDRSTHLITPLVNSTSGCTSAPLTTGLWMSKTASDMATARKTVASARYIPAMDVQTDSSLLALRAYRDRCWREVSLIRLRDCIAYALTVYQSHRRRSVGLVLPSLCRKERIVWG